MYKNTATQKRKDMRKSKKNIEETNENIDIIQSEIDEINRIKKESEKLKINNKELRLIILILKDMKCGSFINICDLTASLDKHLVTKFEIEDDENIR